MLDHDHTETIEIAHLPRNKDGSVRKTFVKSVARRIETADARGLRDLVGDLHGADMGALIEALEPEQRPPGAPSFSLAGRRLRRESGLPSGQLDVPIPRAQGPPIRQNPLNVGHA